MKKPLFKKRKFNGDFRAFYKMQKADDLNGLPRQRGDGFFGDLSNSLYSEQLIQVKVTDIEPFSEDVKRYRLEPIDGKLPFFEAGQSIGVYIKIGAGRFLKPLMICSAPNDKYYSILVFREDFFTDRVLDDWHVGSEIDITSPHGNFKYQPLRDEREVLAFAEDSGISAFMSMAESIVSDKEDFRLTVVYTAKKYDDIVFKKYLDWLQDNSDGKIKFVFLLGEDSHIGCRHGNVTSSLIKSIKDPPYSVFAVGSEEMINRLETHLEKLGIDKKHYHKRIPFVYSNESLDKSKPYVIPKSFYLTVVVGDLEYPPIKIEHGDTLMVAMEKAGLNIPGKCMSGECGYCRSKLLSGDVTLLHGEKRDVADVKYAYIHPCLCYPKSDVKIAIPIKKDEI